MIGGKHGLNDCLWFCAQSALRQPVDQPIRDVLFLPTSNPLKQAIKIYKFAAENRLLLIEIFNASGLTFSSAFLI